MKHWCLPIPLVAAFIAIPQSASAGGLVISAGLEAQATSWETDMAGAGDLRLAYQWKALSLYGATELGLASVDDRVTQHLEIGVEFWLPIASTFGFVRTGLIHRHEIPEDAFSNDFTALLGFGDGIRHRAGVAGAVGLHIPFATHKRGVFFATTEANTDWLVGAAGPMLQWGGAVALGMTYDLTAP